MDFEFNEEQRAFRESARRYLEENYGFDRRQSIVRGAGDHSAEVWKECAEL
ncbi:MAG: pimeloyl-CoA dehydrogenase small subunit, partial [Pseudomonadota bacterium]